MDFCCKLGEEYQLKKNVLYESYNFFVVPTIGQMGIEGYVLLCSKEHYIGIGDIPEKDISELEFVLKVTKKVISETYNPSVLVFEHGPRLGCHKGGGCLEHSHLHIIPTSVNIINFLDETFNPEEVQDFNRLREIYEAKKSSYMFIENQENKRYVIDVELPIPSQYLRHVLALSRGIKNWDWRINPDYETFERTVNQLKGKFSE